MERTRRAIAHNGMMISSLSRAMKEKRTVATMMPRRAKSM